MLALVFAGVLAGAPGACQGDDGVVNVDKDAPARMSACMEKGSRVPFDGVLLSESLLKDRYKSEKLALLMVDISVTATAAFWKAEVDHQKRLVVASEERRKKDSAAAEERRKKDATAYEARIDIAKAAAEPSLWTSPWMQSLTTLFVVGAAVGGTALFLK